MPSEQQMNETFDMALGVFSEAAEANNSGITRGFGAPELSLRAKAVLNELHGLLRQNKLPETLGWQQCNTNKRYVALEYYMGLNQLHDFNEASVWEKVENLYQSTRYLIDYLWTVLELGVTGLDIHYEILQQLNPDGRYSPFTLDVTRADHSDSIPQERLQRLASFWNQIKDEVILGNGGIKFFQYTATDALIKILDIACDKLPACLELARLQLETVRLNQPKEVLSLTPAADIWESFSHQKIHTAHMRQP